MDNLTTEQRSERMSRIRGQDTFPEMVIRSLVFKMGYRYRLHVKNLPGRPDLVFTRRHKAIFVNGCFWHGHPYCKYWRLPKSRVEFWAEKIEANRARDERNRLLLEKEGWSVLVVWECQLKDMPSLEEQIRTFLD